MKQNILATTAILFLVLSSCSSSKVASDYDESINFSAYKTYGFSTKANEIPVDDLVKTRLLNSISSNLNSKGLTESPNPDLLVDLAIKTEKKKDYSNTNVNLSTVWGKKWRFRTGVGKSYSKQIDYTEGTLIIHLVDRAKDMLVWKGSGSGIVKEESLKKENIAMGVNKILENYPPQ